MCMIQYFRKFYTENFSNLNSLNTGDKFAALLSFLLKLMIFSEWNFRIRKVFKKHWGFVQVQ